MHEMITMSREELEQFLERAMLSELLFQETKSLHEEGINEEAWRRARARKIAERIFRDQE